MKTRLLQKAYEKKNASFCDEFYLRGVFYKAVRHWKLFSQVAGNRMYERHIRNKITIEVQQTVEQQKAELDFMQAMVVELEEQYRIELRKKAILKNQCDQAYLRGVSAISNEALKMSQNTLVDIYRGMKMPSYTEQTIYNNMRNLHGHATITGQQHEEYTQSAHFKSTKSPSN